MTHIWMKNNDPSLVLAEQREQHESELAAAANTRRLAVGARDLRHVTWPTVDYYGHDHGKNTSELALHLAQVLKDDDGTRIAEHDLHIIKAAAYFHDLGRTMPWNMPDTDHRARSAELAAKAMASDSENWVPQSAREGVCRLIMIHTLDGPPPSDPRLVVLWDAECLEAARIMPNTAEGWQHMESRYAKLLTPWARDPSIQRRWRAHRGWK